VSRLSQHLAQVHTLRLKKFKKVSDHWLLTWSLGETDDDDRFGFVEGSGWMARLAPVRDELLRGDLRSLYVGWLRAVTTREADVDDLEPQALNGLQELTAAQQALAEFLEVDVDLLAGAGMNSQPIQPAEADEAGYDAWLDQLPESEVRKYLKQIVSGQGASAERELKRLYAAWQARQTPVEQGERRTVATLRQLAEGANERRLSKEAEASRQAEAERKKLRDMKLANLAKDFPRAWNSAHAEAAKGYASAYDTACRQLVDLRDAYHQQAMSASFQTEFQQFMDKHRHRKALMTRLVKAGLCPAN
jgi:hypothetical protein